jgi:hypothetical protein
MVPWMYLASVMHWWVAVVVCVFFLYAGPRNAEASSGCILDRQLKGKRISRLV